MRDAATRMADVRNLLVAAGKVTEARAQIAGDLAHASGLSPQGVELAFMRHLERDASDADLASLIAYAGDAESVLLILSANVFVAALRAIAIARAASSRVVVRPSRREPFFARALIAAANDPSITLVEDAQVEDAREGELHVYGTDGTIARVQSLTRPGVRVRAHGSGMGVAWISARANLPDAAAALADDVIAFDQRGCLSPRIALVQGPQARADAFGHAVHRALDQAQRKIPRGDLDQDERAAASIYVATLQYAGRVYGSGNHVVGVGTAGAPLLLPPPGRHVHVAAVRDARSAHTLLTPISRAIVAIGTDDRSVVQDLVLPQARVSTLGEMQCPPLDGPVDRR